MSSERSLCEVLADAERWDEWLSNGLPEELKHHVDSCEVCRQLFADLSEIGDGLASERERTAAMAEEIDISKAVLAKVSDRPRFRYAPIAAAALVLVALGVAVMKRPEVVQIASKTGVSVTHDGATRSVRSDRVELPVRIAASAGETATARGEGLELAVDPGTTIDLQRLDTFQLLKGSVLIDSKQRFSMANPNARIAGLGRMLVDTTETGMEKWKKSTALGAAVVAVMVYTGWAKLSTSQAEIEKNGPIALVADRDGKVASFPIGQGDERGKRSSVQLALSAGKDTPGSSEDASGEEHPASGAFWSEDDKAILFAVEGEVFDSVSGAPIEKFEIEANQTKSVGYGSDDRKTFTFAKKKDGKFQISGLSAGVWRMTARSDGYAPVAQTIDLSQAAADPYAVFPLSSGARVSGTVVDTRGRGIEGARVGLESCFAKGTKNGCPIVDSKSDGSFVLESVPAEEIFSVRAEHERYGTSVRHSLKRAEGETEHVRIELPGVLRVFGQVTRGQKEKPVDGAVILVGSEGKRVTTDAQGRYEVFVPLQTRPEVFVETTTREGFKVRFASYPSNRSAESIRWVNAETHVAETEKNFRLAMDKARLFGRITDGTGAPVPNAMISIHNNTGWYRKKGGRGHETFPEQTKTDAEGKYAIDGVPVMAGYLVRYKSDEGGQWQQLGYVNIEDETEVEANFEIGSGTIRGRFVHKKTRTPFKVSGRSCGRIGAKREGASFYAEPRCFDDGRFEFLHLPPGKYVVENQIPWMESPIQIGSATAVVRSGAIADGVDLEAEGEESDVWSFRVTDVDGRVLTQGHIRYHQEHTSFTENLNVGVDGVTKHSLNRTYKSVFFDHPGYDSQEVSLIGRDPSEVISVRLNRSVQ